MRNFLSTALLVAACAHTSERLEVKKPELICPSRSRPVEGTESRGFMDALTGETGKKITACLDKEWFSFDALEPYCKRQGGRVRVLDWTEEEPHWGCAVMEEVRQDEKTGDTEK